ncbi:MAG: ABC transporter ATP-binding protein [Thermoplasmatota archaeon]
MISVRDITFGYNGGDPVLRDINLELEKGGFLGILGPNGSGKSTLLGLMCGTLRPGKGEVTLDGMNVYSWSRKEIAKRIAVVPQESYLGFEYRVEEVVSMGRYPHIGRFSFIDPGGKEVVERAMEATETLDLREKTVDRLSGGERQRVMIARALAQEPGILMLDEPTKNLDIRHSLDIMELVGLWNKKRGLTVVAVLHDLDLASRYCSTCILLKDGRISSMGRTSFVIKPENIDRVFGVKSKVRKVDGAVKVDIIR